MPKPVQAPGPFLQLMLDKYKLNPFKLSKEIQLSQSAVRLITIGKTRISVPVALRLAKYFNTNPEYWLIQQMRYDLAEAEKDKDLNRVLKSIPKVKKGVAEKAAPKAKAPAAKKPAAKKAVAKKPAAKKVAAVKGKKASAKPKAAAGKGRGRPRKAK